MLWKILDYSISQLSTTCWGPHQSHGAEGSNLHAKLHVDTVFVHPVVEEHAEQEDTGCFIEEPNEMFGDLFPDNFHFDYSLLNFP